MIPDQRPRKGQTFKAVFRAVLPEIRPGRTEDCRKKLAAFKQVDFVKYSFPAYQSPAQFKQFNQFLIDNTDQAYLFYEPENETNLKYFYNMIIAASDYPLFRLTFDDLNEVMSE